MTSVSKYVNKNLHKELFIEQLGWSQPRSLPNLHIAYGLHLEKRSEAIPIAQWKGLSVWKIKGALSRKERRQVALDLNSQHMDSLLIFVDGQQQTWMWPEAKAIPRSQTRLTAQTHLSIDERNDALERRLSLLNVRRHQDLGTATEILQRVKNAFDSDAHAAETIADVHDALYESGFGGVELEIFLTRLLFCFFGDDSELFGPAGVLGSELEELPKDGSRTQEFFEELFQSLQDGEGRMSLGGFPVPYANGGLFSLQSDIPEFTNRTHDLVIKGSRLEWSELSPAIFGSMFQGILDQLESHELDSKEPYSASRSQLGAHYTSEINILKAIGPLFLDSLRSRFQDTYDESDGLIALHKHIAQLTFLDPACGCGNFLVVTYKELRFLEIDIIVRLRNLGVEANSNDSEIPLLVDIDQFFGIEIVESAANIAKVALWITDHQMNLEAQDRLGYTRATLPLHAAARIVTGNALTKPWDQVLEPDMCDYVLGNPPFLGARKGDSQPRADLRKALSDLAGASHKFDGSTSSISGELDLVAGWFARATEFMIGSKKTDNPFDFGSPVTVRRNRWWEDSHEDLSPRFGAGKQPKCAFVATSSITQGEQVAALWDLLRSNGVFLSFGFRPFKWTNDARGVAQVHCVILGFGLQDLAEKFLFHPTTKTGDTWEKTAHSSISPYLTPGPLAYVTPSNRPIDGRASRLVIGNKPIDGGNLILEDFEAQALCDAGPEIARFVKKYVGGRELMSGSHRWILDLRDGDLNTLKEIPVVAERLDSLRSFRESSKSAGTRRLALDDKITRFHVEFKPSGDAYFALPKLMTQALNLVPVQKYTSDYVPSDLVSVVDNTSNELFAILSSRMNFAWMWQVSGRMGDQYRYSAEVVYNTLPWPRDFGESGKLDGLVARIYDLRELHWDAALGELYGADEMPLDLKKAHDDLDMHIDACYGYSGDGSNESRFAFLFGLYHESKNLNEN